MKGKHVVFVHQNIYWSETFGQQKIGLTIGQNFSLALATTYVPGANIMPCDSLPEHHFWDAEGLCNFGDGHTIHTKFPALPEISRINVIDIASFWIEYIYMQMVLFGNKSTCFRSNTCACNHSEMCTFMSRGKHFTGEEIIYQCEFSQTYSP